MSFTKGETIINPHMGKGFEKGFDNVDKPQHYMLFPDTETIEVIQSSLTIEEYKGYLKGNVLKYRLRAGKKRDTIEDINKALKYEEILRGV